MADVERAANVPDNPYVGRPAEVFPPNHPIHKLKRMVYIGISLYALNHFQLYQTILFSPNIRHEWFKIGLGTTIAILGIKAYVEMYEGRMRKQQVNYKNYPNSTHAVIMLFLLATAAFNMALWPHYGWNSPIVLGILFWGVLFQFLLMVPTYVQNVVAFALLTFFLQQYS